MTGRIEVHPERVTCCLAWLHFVLRSAQRQHQRLDRIDVIHGYVEVKLLRPLAIRPCRRCELFHQLERQTQPVHREDHPIVLDERDLPAEDSTIELGECLGVRAIEDHGAHACERHSPAVCHGEPAASHRESRRTSRPRWLARSKCQAEYVGVTDEVPRPDAVESYAMGVAAGSYDWYKVHAIGARRMYKISESTVLVLAAAIPVAAAMAPGSAIVPAVLGGIVVVITGLRGVFHWQDNYLRFSGAREAVEAQRRLYITRSAPYDDASTRDEILVSSVTRIEQQEMGGWFKVASKQPKV